MHHTMKLYSRYREKALLFYISAAKLTKIPLIGRLVRLVANTFGEKLESAYIMTTDEACQIVDISSQLYLGPCTCREVFKNCDNPIMAEIMIGFHTHAFVDERPEDYRKLTKEEAKEVLRQCHERGLMHTIIKCKNEFYAVCNCCTCCCVPYRLSKQYGIGKALKRHENIVELFKQTAVVTANEHNHQH